MEELKIVTPFIKLDQLVKFVGFTETGAKAKILIDLGEFNVNGVCCTKRGKKIKPGDVMVFKQPYDKERLLIKRVSEVFRGKDGKVQSIFFLGDNSPDSYDSRNFGYVLVEDLVSKVIKPRKKEDYLL